MDKQHSSLDFIEVKPKETHRASVIWLHGLGADGYDFVDIPPMLDLPAKMGIHFIFPHAPVRPVSLNGGYKMRAWFDLYSLSPDAEQDAKGIYEAQKLINNIIDQEIASGIPADKIILAGFSQGAALALYAGLHYPQQLGGILALSGFLVLAGQTPLAKDSPNSKIPILLMHGQGDDVVPINLAETTRNKLLVSGFSSDFKVYPMGHSVCAEELQDIAKWLQGALA